MTTHTQPSIRLDGLGKTFRIYARPEYRLLQALVRGRRHLFTEHRALAPLSLEVAGGETLGIIGTNGSGKSTLLQMICGTLTPSCGHVEARGRISALLELGAGFNPDFSGRENILLNAAILGMNPEEIAARYPDIVAFSGLEAGLLERPVSTYSSGMYVRLAFAVAIAARPDILIIDEALAVGDEAFQRKCYARIRELKEQGTTILFVSHASQTVISLCDRVLWLDQGEVMQVGEPKPVVEAYHRYIYSPEAARPAMRAAILRGEVAASMGQGGEEGQLPSRRDYAPQGAKILDPHLEDAAGQRVSVLRAGERYVYAYQVRFDAPQERVRCGMMIRTQNGIELGGGHTARLGKMLDQVEAGTLLEVRFSFTCALRPGTYFLNAGVATEQEGERVFLHRILDACMLRVMPDERDWVEGLVDFAVEPDVLMSSGT